jgi:hypothetical protein
MTAQHFLGLFQLLHALHVVSVIFDIVTVLAKKL